MFRRKNSESNRSYSPKSNIYSRDDYDNDYRRMKYRQQQQLKERTILHEFIHKRCKLCSTRFFPTNYCTNCCTPMCQNFFNNKNEWKSYYSRQNNSRYDNGMQLNSMGNFLQTSIVVWSNDNVNNNNNNSNDNRKDLNTNVVNNLNASNQSLSSRSRSSRSTTPLMMNSCDSNLNQQSTPPPPPPTTMTIMPSAPSIGNELYNNEEKSDIIFLVGYDKNKQWRFPVHSDYLKNISPYFDQLLNDININNNKEIKIDWCEPELFEIILRYAYLNEIKFNSIDKTLKLFQISNQMQMYQLSQLCLTFLAEQSNRTNVLKILLYFYKYFHYKLILEKKSSSSSPLLMNKHSSLPNDMNINESIIGLLQNCLKIFDKHCEFIIQTNEFLLIDDKYIIRLLLSRDTLNLSGENEILIYKTLIKWSEYQCKQKCLQITNENQCKILNSDDNGGDDNLLYLSRYILMNLDDYLNNGPYNDQLLSNADRELFKQILIDKNNGKSIEMPEKFKAYKLNVSRNFPDDNNEKILDDNIEIPMVKKSRSYENGFAAATNTMDKCKNGKNSMQKKIGKGFLNVMVLIMRVLD